MEYKPVVSSNLEASSNPKGIEELADGKPWSPSDDLEPTITIFVSKDGDKFIEGIDITTNDKVKVVEVTVFDEEGNQVSKS